MVSKTNLVNVESNLYNSYSLFVGGMWGDKSVKLSVKLKETDLVMC